MKKRKKFKKKCLWNETEPLLPLKLLYLLFTPTQSIKTSLSLQETLKMHFKSVVRDRLMSYRSDRLEITAITAHTIYMIYTIRRAFKIKTLKVGIENLLNTFKTMLKTCPTLVGNDRLDFVSIHLSLIFTTMT